MHADPTVEIQELLDRAVAGRPGPGAVDDLAGWWDRSPSFFEPIAERWVRAAVADLAPSGWRPADVERAVQATAPKPQGDLLARLELGAGPWRVRHGMAAGLAVAHLVSLRHHLRRLSSIPFVTEGDAAAGVEPAVLAKVRALLAKAESTTFEAESEALMAKAHQLMVRHAIDQAVLEGRPGRGEVTARRVFLDDPYARAKFSLLSQVARASTCRALLSTSYGFATVFGHAADLDAVELLYTSLLLQATAGVVDARPATTRRLAAAQVAAFRRAWLEAFAHRIGERLARASADAVTAAGEVHGDALLPVLVAKEDAVEQAMREAAPNVRHLRTTVSSGEGWAAGAAAGDRAVLAGQAPLPTRRGALGRG